MQHRQPRFQFLMLAIFAVFSVATPSQVKAQCGGTLSLPPTILADGTMAATEIAPNSLVLDPLGTPVCLPASGVILGGVSVTTDTYTSLTTFTAAPGIDVTAGASTSQHLLPGTTLLGAGGSLATLGPGASVEMFAITDTAVCSLALGVLSSSPLPAGSLPIAAVAVAAGAGGFSTLSLNVQTTEPSIFSIFNGVATNHTIPAPIVDTTLSYTNGAIAGVIVSCGTDAYAISGGTMSTISYGGGTYIGNVVTPGELVIAHTLGLTNIPLAPGTAVVAASPLTGSATPIAINQDPVANIAGVVAAWPPNALAQAFYPGNGSDLALNVSISGGAPNSTSGLHIVTVSDTFLLSAVSPNGTLDGAPMLLLAELFPTGAPPAENVFLPGLYHDPTNPTFVLADGINPTLPIPNPTVGTYQIGGALPLGLAGANTSILLTLIAIDVSKLFNLGIADAQEFRIP